MTSPCRARSPASRATATTSPSPATMSRISIPATAPRSSTCSPATSSTTCRRPTSSASRRSRTATASMAATRFPGVVTAQMLIDAIAAIGGPDYVYVEIAPSTPNSTGGEPGGNIRNGYPLQSRPRLLCRGQRRADRGAGLQRQPQAAGRRLHLQRRDGDADQRPLHLAPRQRSPVRRQPAAGSTPATARAPPRPRRSAPMSTTRSPPIRRCSSACSATSTASISRMRSARSRPAACSPTCTG